MIRLPSELLLIWIALTVLAIFMLLKRDVFLQNPKTMFSFFYAIIPIYLWLGSIGFLDEEFSLIKRYKF